MRKRELIVGCHPALEQLRFSTPLLQYYENTTDSYPLAGRDDNVVGPDLDLSRWPNGI